VGLSALKVMQAECMNIDRREGAKEPRIV